MERTIGIDLGGTSIYGGIIDKQGNILKRASRDTKAANGKKGVLDLIAQVIGELIQGENILSIGIGSPGFIDSKEGKVLQVGGNIEGWANTDIRGELCKEFPNIPIFVENDANVAALCEHWIGAAKDLSSFLMLTLGTGLGGAIYTEREGLLTGHQFQGAELGHAILFPKGRLCNCGQRGCVERYISGTAVENRYIELTGIEKKGKEIFKSSKADNIAGKVVDEFAENLAIYMVSLKNIFDPEGIVIGGGIINSMEYWWDNMLDYYREYSNNPDGMKIIPAIYLNDAGMIGAGKIAFERLNQCE
ncbi:MAG: ROK family protein [Tissierellaceae bacterium]